MSCSGCQLRLLLFLSISVICCLCCDGVDISIPRITSLISDSVSEATFTLNNDIIVYTITIGYIVSLILLAIISQDEIL